MYEVIAILNPNVTNEFVEQKISDWTEIIKEYDAKLQRIDRWGKKNLAYEVKKFKQGYFLLLHIEGEHAVIAELERRFRIADEVIRYQTVKLNELEYKTSVELLDQMVARTQEELDRIEAAKRADEAPADAENAPKEETAPEAVEEVPTEQEKQEETKEEKPAEE